MTDRASRRRDLGPLVRVALWTLVGAALFELAWLGFFQWIESSGRLRSWANRRPDKVRLDFAAASSIWPGLIEIDGLVVRGRTSRGIDWQVTADRVEAQIALAPMAARRLVVRGAEVAGVEVRSLRPAEEGDSEARRAAARAMRPMEAPPKPMPIVGGVPRPERRQHSRWSFEFHRLRVHDVRSIVVDDSDFTGNLRGELGFAVRSASGEAEIYASEIEVADLLLRHRGAELARELGGTIEIEVAPYRYREERGRALLPYASGRIRLRGLLDDRPLLAELLRRAPWLKVEAGLEPIVADLRLERGRLLAGSRLDSARSERTVQALDFVIGGESALSLVVDRVDGVESARWQLLYEGFTVHRQGIAAPLLIGSGLAVVGVARPPDLAELAERSELRLELGSARLPDLAFLADFVPPGARLERLGGSAEVKGFLSTDVADLRPSGAIEARFDQLTMRWAGIDLNGRLEAKLVVAGGDLAARRLELGGSRLLLADFAAPGLAVEGTPAPAKWWMQLLVDDGSVVLGPPLAVQTRFQTRLRDTAPLVALFETRRNLPRWAERLLTEEDVRATGSLRAGPGELEVERIDTELLGGKLSMRLRFEGAERRGQLLLAWQRFALGAGFDGDKRELRLVNAREWFGAGL